MRLLLPICLILVSCRTTQINTAPLPAAGPEPVREGPDTEPPDAGPPPEPPDAGRPPEPPEPMVSATLVDAGAPVVRPAPATPRPTPSRPAPRPDAGIAALVVDAGVAPSSEPAAPPPAPPSLWTQRPGASAGFSGVGPAGFTIEGTTSSVTVTDDGRVFTVVVDLASMKTGIALRDEHMREKYLHVDRFPSAVLTVPRQAVALPDEGPRDGTATGSMSIHGVTKEQPFTFKATCAKRVCDVAGTAKLNFNDFGVAVPSYLGITVKPNVTVTAKFRLARE
ncbi:MAG: YceI family protein [Myxococcaceae bacterium]|nr:YceI family protein [Myxococcaceae bacterium]